MNENLTKAGSLSISGSGEINGGTYESVQISGSAKITGDVTALNRCSCSGSTKIVGSLKTKQLHCSGSCSIAGSLEAQEIHSSGSWSVGGAMVCQDFRSSGSTKIGKDLRARTVDCSGALTVHGDVAAEQFTLAGGFSIDGLLNADRIRIKLGNDAMAREIGGTIVECRSHRSNRFLRVETVEADEIHLENTLAQVVRGRIVRIGPACKIQRVEYAESLEVSPGAEVSQQVKV